MKTQKRVLSLLLSAALLFPIFLPTVVASTPEDSSSSLVTLGESESSIEPEPEAPLEPEVPLLVEPTLLETLLAFESLAELQEALALLTEDQLASFDTESLDAIAAHYEALALEQESQQIPPEATNFSAVGPFLPPVDVATPKIAKRTRRAVTPPTTDVEGLITHKTATEKADGSVTLTMEAYAEGIVTSSTKTVPVDIVLVLDQSSSMDRTFSGIIINKITRQEAMKDAVETFINSVHEKYTPSSDHRMAVVTFGDNAHSLHEWTDVDEVGRASLHRSILNLPASPSGATNIAAGMSEAEALMGQEYQYQGPNTQRQKIVIVFTDGVPSKESFLGLGEALDIFDVSTADSAIASSQQIKKAGCTVYSIGIFGGANPDELYGTRENYRISSNGTVGSSWSIPKLGSGKSVDIPAGNRFLNYLSSNALGATSNGLKGTSRLRWTITQNYTADTSAGYYLTAGDADALSDIFQTISDNIVSPAIELGKEAVLQDVLTPYFQLAGGVGDIAGYVSVYNGDTQVFGAPQKLPAGELSIQLEGDNTIRISGFDFSRNFVSDTQKPDGSYGKKLIIEIPIVPKSDFFGGDSVPTNEPSSGIFENATTKDILEQFPVPFVSVPVKDIAITTQDRNVYLGGSPTAPQLLADTTVMLGQTGASESPAFSFRLDSEGNPIGLAPWQHEFVELDFHIEAGQTAVEEFHRITEDTAFCAVATITSLENPQNKRVGRSEQQKLLVFKPVLTYQDSEIAYGSLADYQAQNLPSNHLLWKRGVVSSADVTLLGSQPALSYEYNPAAGRFATDTNVYVRTFIDALDITEHTTFINHSETHTETAEYQFTVFVQTVSLTIQKSGVSPLDKNQSFLFHIQGNKADPNTKDIALTVALVGNDSLTIVDLPGGTYTVTEDSKWSWRYMPDETTKEISFSTVSATLTFSNRRYFSKWLTGSSYKKNNFYSSSAA